MYFLDVGQGDAAFIVTPNNTKILVDGGLKRQALGFLIWKYRLDQPGNTVTIDNASANPVVVESQSQDRSFYPNGDGREDTLSVWFRLSEPVTATVLVTDTGGATVRSC